MAFAAETTSLVEELVEAVTGLSAQNEGLRRGRLRDGTARVLRSHTYPRTNPFDVESHLQGLQERFRVNNRDTLADSLAQRLEELKQYPSKYHPEVLFLLLELSDQPTFKSDLRELDARRRVNGDTAAPLRWEDIAAEDGWDEDAALWKTMDFGDSSDDESAAAPSESQPDSSNTSHNEEPFGRTAEDLIIPCEDQTALDIIREAQNWRSSAPHQDATGIARKTGLSEMLVLREILFMLQGLDTTIFDASGLPVLAYQPSHMAWETYKALINWFAEGGRQLRVLRNFVNAPQISPHIQVFQDCISKRLDDFDREVSVLQLPLVDPQGTVAVSIVAVEAKLSPQLEQLTAVAEIVTQLLEESTKRTFLHLELLFDGATVAQLAGRSALYEFLARIFVECFTIYLRPIRHWMDEGALLPGDEVFFVTESQSPVPLSGIWKDRFLLRKDTNGDLHAPRFLHPAAVDIFNAGKNIVVLKQLGKASLLGQKSSQAEPRLDYETICVKGFEMASFPDLFGAAFDRWIQAKYRKTSTTLRDVLFTTCGLSSALDAMQYLYFMSDGAAASTFYEEVFRKMDNLDPQWRDKYVLSGLCQEVFGPLADPSRLSACVSGLTSRASLTEARRTVKTALCELTLHYRLSWPIQMIISEEALTQYREVHTLLLQIRRAQYTLQQPKLMENLSTDHHMWDERAVFYSCRAKLLWFCVTLHTYLATLVLQPNTSTMRQALATAPDVDAMISIHSTFIKQVIDEACLGSRLKPIHDCLLDIFDLALELEQSRAAQDGRKAGESRIALLHRIRADFDRHLRFICGGLRSVARATSDSQSAEWDILAEMLQTGEPRSSIPDI